ncbi:MAG: SWF/SNF helicase family protein [Verrucomicrobia bacterium]|nr:SWF/SNF helicase family protein [Verrucomicrobiota bacterium]
MEELERIGERFFDEDSPLRRECRRRVQGWVSRHPVLQDHAGQIEEIVRRNVRTPSFLVRFFPLRPGRLTEADMAQAFEAEDLSGLTLERLLAHFLVFLAERCGADERQAYLDALARVQTGSHAGQDIDAAYSDDELQGAPRERLLPNVRLVNGGTASDTRQRLMLAFNTPFYPEVLVASSVMAEGVDLHLNCRNVIHHDLSWNPSTLEQRTGRVDRIGAKAELCGRSIHVYLPFIAETQDEKQFRVVLDRERWFKVVMGEKYKLDLRTTDRLAARLPIPAQLADDLVFRLDVEIGSAAAGFTHEYDTR